MGFLAVAAVAAVGAMILGGVAVLRDSRGILFALAALSSVALFFAAYGAARF